MLLTKITINAILIATSKTSHIHCNNRKCIINNILITGATGFLGAHLAKALATSSDQIYYLIRPEAFKIENTNVLNSNKKIPKKLYGNIFDINFLIKIISENNINIIYHLAANNNNLTPNNFYDLYEVNLRGTYSLLEACRSAASVRLIVFSSSEEVIGIFDKNNLDASYNPYMASKAASELVIKAHYDNSGQNVAVIRMSNLYGGGDLNFNRLIPAIFRSILRDEPIKLRSNGTHLRDYLYAPDAVNAYQKITDNYLQNLISGHHKFQLASESRVSTLDMIAKVTNICSKQVDSLPMNSSNHQLEERAGVGYDLSVQQQLINWKSETSLDQGLHQTYLWYKNYFLNNKLG